MVLNMVQWHLLHFYFWRGLAIDGGEAPGGGISLGAASGRIPENVADGSGACLVVRAIIILAFVKTTRIHGTF